MKTVIKKYSAKKEVVISPLENVYNSEESSASVSVVIEDVEGICQGDKLCGSITEKKNKFIGTKTTVSKNGKNFEITAENIPDGSAVVLAMYNEDVLCDVKKFTYCGEIMEYAAGCEFAKAKVMVWDGVTGIRPICPYENVEF